MLFAPDFVPEWLTLVFPKWHVCKWGTKNSHLDLSRQRLAHTVFDTFVESVMVFDEKIHLCQTVDDTFPIILKVDCLTNLQFPLVSPKARIRKPRNKKNFRYMTNIFKVTLKNEVYL